MQTSRIVYLLEPYHNNLSKHMIKTPMLYFIDTGLYSYDRIQPIPIYINRFEMDKASSSCPDYILKLMDALLKLKSF
ncbi:MAG: DUF4143 domain-containing protein [Armatimonadota bacterium]